MCLSACVYVLRWFYIVSGDSVPTKPPSSFSNPPFTSSITGARPFKDPNYAGWYYGSQWMALTREHVQLIVDNWPTYKPIYYSTHRDFYCPHGNPLDCPDEQYLHTLLHSDLKQPINHRNTTIMEEEVIHNNTRTCSCLDSDQRARTYTASDTHTLKQLLTRAKAARLTFAFRKVDSTVPTYFLQQLLLQ